MKSAKQNLPSVAFRSAPHMRFPGAVAPWSGKHDSDCNSPAWWWNDRLYMLNSAAHPWVSSGPDLFHLGPSAPISYTNDCDGGRWIEATYTRADGTVYGFYHNEPLTVFSGTNKAGNSKMTSPRIGVARCRDDGLTWDDLGFISICSDEALRPDTHNYFFGGGNGDFSLLPDPDEEFLYVLTGTYHKDPAEQGISILRMRVSYLDAPSARRGSGTRAAGTSPVWAGA